MPAPTGSQGLPPAKAWQDWFTIRLRTWANVISPEFFGTASGSVAARRSGPTAAREICFNINDKMLPYLLGADLSSGCAILRVLHKEILASTAEHTAALHERFAKAVPCRDKTKLLDLKELQAAGSSPSKETVMQSLKTSHGWYQRPQQRTRNHRLACAKRFKKVSRPWPMTIWGWWVVFFGEGEVARSGSRWLFVAFLSGEWLGALFLPSLPVADNIHNSRVSCAEAVSHTNNGLPIADLTATGILLLQNCSRPRPRLTTDCPTFRKILLQRQLPRLPRLQTATTIGELRSKLLLRFWLCGLPAVEGEGHSSSLRHKVSSDDAMSRTKQSWNCSHQRVRAGIAHGLRMVRLHVGDCHVRVLIDDDDTITRITIWRVVLPH